MGLALQIAAGILIAVFVLFVLVYFVLPWLSAVIFLLRLGKWKLAWKAFWLQLDDLDDLDDDK